MKKIITIILGATYATFACFMASGSKTIPFNCATRHRRTCVIVEKSDKPDQQFYGLEDMPLIPEMVDGKPAKYQMPPQAKSVQSSDYSIIAKITKVEPELKFEPNCMIFWSMEGCETCKKMRPIVAKLIKEGYDIHTLPIEKYPKLAKKMGVSSFPTIIIKEDRKEVKRFVGLTTGRQIKKYLKYNEPDYDLS